MRFRNTVIMASLACGMLSAAAPNDAARMLDAAPLRFEPAPHAAEGSYVARGLRASFAFRGNQVVYQAGAERVRLEFEGAGVMTRLEGAEKLRATSTVMKGNDRSQWVSGVSNYGRLVAHGLYPGIDAVYYGTARELEYDLMVKPGGDPKQIRLRISGSKAELDKQGNLVAGLIQKRPVAYQIGAGGKRISVESAYRRNADGTFGFELGKYDAARELVIDPVVSFSAYLDGTAQEVATSIGHDGQGNLYIGGTTSSYDFPTTDDAYQPVRNALRDLFVVKLDPRAAAGSQVLYATYIGGSGTDLLYSMVVTTGGQVYMTGSTDSTDFPTTNAGQAANGGGLDAFVVWLDPVQGTSGLRYSSFFGGTGDEVGNDLALDARGRIFVTGATTSDDFTVKGTPYQSVRAGSSDAFVAAFDPNQVNEATIFYTTYFGGTGWDAGRGIAAGPGGTFWVVGGTFSYDMPLVGYSYQPNYRPGGDGFVFQLNPARTGSDGLVYASYLGGSDLDEAYKVLVEPTGLVVIMGYTDSTDFPMAANAMQRTSGGDTDVFLMVLNTANPVADRSAQLVYSTYYGGSDGDVAKDLKRDSTGKYYLTGYTYSRDLPLSVNALQPTHSDGLDAFVIKIDPAQAGAAGISYATLIGAGGLQSGNGVDILENTGTIYVTGYTTSSIFDNIGGVKRTNSVGGPNAFLLGVKP